MSSYRFTFGLIWIPARLKEWGQDWDKDWDIRRVTYGRWGLDIRQNREQGGVAHPYLNTLIEAE